MTPLQLSDPREFVQYIVSAVNANPDLREPLLRALLTEEFLQMPARLARLDDVPERLARLDDVPERLARLDDVPERLARVEEDVAVLKEDVGTLKDDVKVLKDDVGRLRGKSHETDFARTATSLLNRELGFRRITVVHGNVIAIPRYAEEFHDKAFAAADDGVITDGQLQRIFDTDVIAHCRRPGETEPTWVAVEVAARVDEDDINRAAQSAQALRLAFSEDALSVIAGERIDPQDATRAKQAGVVFIDISQRF